MLYNGQYFRKGTKRALDELRQLKLPSAKNLFGTYEEMYSNWKNKMVEAADRGDVYSSFMNLLSLQNMFHEIAEGIAVDDLEIMDKFDSKNLEGNAEVFDKALSNYHNVFAAESGKFPFRKNPHLFNEIRLPFFINNSCLVFM